MEKILQNERGMNLNKEKIVALYLLWVLVLLIEIGWLYGVTRQQNSAEEIIFVVTIIAVTLTLGHVGMKMFQQR